MVKDMAYLCVISQNKNMPRLIRTTFRLRVIAMTLFLLAASLIAKLPSAEASDGGSLVREGGSFSYYLPGDRKEALARQYPDGSVGGQCGDFGAKVMGKPFFQGGTGGLNSFRFKLTLTDPLAGSEGHPVAVGDAIVQDMKNSVGHFAVINTIGQDSRSRIFYTLTESNWNKDGKVTNDRVIYVDDASIKGIVRGGGASDGQPIVRYDDRLTFPFATSSAELNAAGYIRSAVRTVALSNPMAAGTIRDTVQKMLDGHDYVGAIGYLLPFVGEQGLVVRLTASMKNLQPPKPATLSKTETVRITKKPAGDVREAQL